MRGWPVLPHVSVADLRSPTFLENGNHWNGGFSIDQISMLLLLLLLKNRTQSTT